MRVINMKTLSGALGASALLFTYGCGGTQASTGVSAQQIAAAQPQAPVVVSCEPHQRTLVRPVVVNGQALSQVECVAADRQETSGYAPTAGQAVPAGYYAAPQQVQPVVYEDLAPARVVSAPAPRTVARPVRTRQVVYDEPVRVEKKRSVKKSVAIIGSSAAVGAGVGAITGGKKGALIGAAIGGGGAAIWDQVTRR